MAVLSKGSKHPKLFELTNGVDVDRQFANAEIKVQKSWANALKNAEVLNDTECEKLLSALNQILDEIHRNQFEWRVEDEDIHMNLERRLTEDLGVLGKKIHLGRSRNDLIATTLRVHIADSLEAIEDHLRSCIKALLSLAENQIDIVAPGMTHLQAGQPIRVSHIWVSYAQNFLEDLERLSAARKLTKKYLPLGSAALAGSTLSSLDLKSLALELGFENPPLNSYQSVGSRDFICDALSAISILGVHLSRLGEDVILWSSAPFGWIELPEEFSTGSSIMPNKKNPDVAELMRAKSAHLISSQNNVMALLKGMPSSYSTDLHETKEIYLRAEAHLNEIFGVLNDFISNLKFKPEALQKALMNGHVLATEIANTMVSDGIHFRDAYHLVSQWIQVADQKGLQIHELKQEDVNLGEISPEIFSRAMKISFEEATEKRQLPGGTSRDRVLESVQIVRDQL